MRTSIGRPALWAIISFVVGMLGLISAAPAQQQYDFTAGLLYGGLYAPEQWNAVNLSFRNSGESAVEGEARLPISNDPGKIEVRVPVFVPPHSRLRVAAAVFMPPPVQVRGKERIPPISVIEWHDKRGARIARSELVGQSVSGEAATDTAGFPAIGFLLSVTDRETSETDVDYCTQLVAHLKARGIHCTEPSVPADNMPSEPALLAACRVVAIRKTNPDSLDQAQRAALLDYVRAGGILLIASPRQADGLEQSWLAPYLPVRLVGWRQAKQVAGLALQGWMDIAEATPADGVVLLRDKDFVHAAYRQLGLGRIVFASFPASGAVEKQPAAAKLWQDLLAVQRPPVGMEGTRLRRDYGKFMEPMLGRPAAPWSAAAITIGVYLAIILGVQIWFRGVKRPLAFAAALSAALVIALFFLGLTAFKRQSQSLQSARLAVIDVGLGGGTAQELQAFAGADDRDFGLKAVNDRVSLHPIYNQGDIAIVTVPSFTAPGAGVAAERVTRVWESRWPAGSQWDVSAIGTFTPQGLSLRVKSAAELSLAAAQFVWQHERFTVGEVTGEERQVAIGDANRRPPGEFMVATGIASQDQRQKGDILAALLDRMDFSPTAVPTDAAAMLAWVNNAPQTLQTTAPVTQRGDQTLVRSQVFFESTKKGQKIHVDGSLSRIDLREFRGLPYNAAKSEWNPTNLPGRWLIAVRAPAQAGTLRMEKVRLNLEFDAPAYEVTLRRGQVRGGKVTENPNGALLKQWSGPIGPQAPIEFECESSDFDAGGRVWLLLDVNLPKRPSGGLIPFWRVVQLSAALDGEVIAPPAEDVPGVLR